MVIFLETEIFFFKKGHSLTQSFKKKKRKKKELISVKVIFLETEILKN